MLFTAVDPQNFIDTASFTPAYGRGAWTRKGIDFDYRYAMSDDVTQRIGTRADVSLDHWAVSVGSYMIQKRLVSLGFLDAVSDGEKGIFGPRTKSAVMAFQRGNKDPDGGAQLIDDGTVGRSDARALFAPLARKAERKYNLPGGYLIGETYHESAMDPGAIGYYIYYPEYRGVDRGMSQINSRANAVVSWVDAFDPVFALDWSAKRLRDYHDQFASRYPSQPDSVLWDAALCAHNNPYAANLWAQNGYAPTDEAQRYVTGVKNAIF